MPISQAETSILILILWRGSLLVARELAPAGLRSRPIFWGRFATQREQAPSPQGQGQDRGLDLTDRHQALGAFNFAV